MTPKINLLLALTLLSLLLFSERVFAVYDPTEGRWISRDPYGDPSEMAVANDGRLLRFPISLSMSVELRVGPNLYSYVKNDPINKTDPSGLIMANPIPVSFYSPELHGYLICTIGAPPGYGVRKACHPATLAACAADAYSVMELAALMGDTGSFSTGCSNLAQCIANYY